VDKCKFIPTTHLRHAPATNSRVHPRAQRWISNPQSTHESPWLPGMTPLLHGFHRPYDNDYKDLHLLLTPSWKKTFLSHARRNVYSKRQAENGG
jgi:hypothetical protein